MDQEVMNDHVHLLPSPSRVSYPWTEFGSDLQLEDTISKRNSEQKYSEEDRSGLGIMTSEQPRERKRWIIPSAHEVTDTGYNRMSQLPVNAEEKEIRDILIENSTFRNRNKRHFPNLKVGTNNCNTQGFVQNKHCTFAPGFQEDSPLDSSLEKHSSDEQIQEIIHITDSPVTARIPSPSSASSITSGRRLEWDSGADVGYNIFHNNACTDNLSTIERIALVHGCSSFSLRSDPEGTCAAIKQLSNNQSSNITFQSPVAKSTPIYKLDCDFHSEGKETNSDVFTPKTGANNIISSDFYFHAGEEHESRTPNYGDVDKSGERNIDTKESQDKQNVNLKKHSSLTDLSKQGENIESELPRSQSFLSMMAKAHENTPSHVTALPSNQQTLAAACSASSSSVATIVPKLDFPKTCDKLVQTLPTKFSVAIQTNESSSSANSLHSESDKLDVDIKGSNGSDNSGACKSISINNTLESGTCTGAHKKGSELNGSTCQHYSFENSENISQNASELKNGGTRKYSGNSQRCNQHTFSDKETGTLESASVSISIPTAASSNGADSSHSGPVMQAEALRESSGLVNSANSFEYLPGSIFENGMRVHNEKIKQPVVKDSASENSANQISSDKCDSRIGYLEKSRSSSTSSSVTRDIEEGVELLRRLVVGKECNRKIKKALIRQIINKLVESDYSEDLNKKPSAQNISLASNVPWVPAHPSVGLTRLSERCNGTSEKDWSEVPEKSSSQCSKMFSDKCIGTVFSDAGSVVASLSTASGSVSVPGDNEETHAETTEISSSSLSKDSSQNWRKATTQSERQFEMHRLKDKRTDSSLLKFCRTEHEKQLRWIQFEINHLSNLKQLLEKQEGLTKALTNLTSHEHKYHSLKQLSPEKKAGHSHRTHPRGRDHCTETSKSSEDSSLQNSDPCYIVTSKTPRHTESPKWPQQPVHKTGKYIKQDIPLPKDGEHISKFRTLTPVKDRHDCSIQTQSFDSYTIYKENSPDIDFGSTLDQGENRGRINVFSQTSPKLSVNKFRTNQVKVPTETVQDTYEKAVKCCCECRKALQELVGTNNKSGTQESCENKTIKILHKRTETIGSDSSSVASIQKQSVPDVYVTTNAEKTLPHPYKKTVGTETVDDKSIQTSSSLLDMPVIKPVWSVNCMQTESEKTMDHSEKSMNTCPCCKKHLFNPHTISHSSETSNENMSTLHTSESGNMDEIKELPEDNVQTLLHNKASEQPTPKKIPLAYVLTFEPTSEENVKRRKDSLPEIKVLVPNSACSQRDQRIVQTDNVKENACPENIKQGNLQEHDLKKLLEEKRQKKHTLQEYLKANRPDYIELADKRSQCLADLALLRELRKQKRHELLTMSSTERGTTASLASTIPLRRSTSHTTRSKSSFTTKTMREQSERLYHQTREMKNKLTERKRKEDFRTNRLMAELFTKKLQMKALRGVVNHSNSASVISSDP